MTRGIRARVTNEGLSVACSVCSFSAPLAGDGYGPGVAIDHVRGTGHTVTLREMREVVYDVVEVEDTPAHGPDPWVTWSGPSDSVRSDG